MHAESSDSRSPAMLTAVHRPVLLAETIAGLAPVRGGRYIDATFGGGGHSRALLEQSAPDGRLLALDVDPAAVTRADVLAVEFGDRFAIAHGSFGELDRIAIEHGFDAVDGVLLDLGLSSFQLDDPKRGFAFRLEGPLDMRFDPSRGTPASALLDELPETAIADLLWRYGEERRSRRIAAAIVRARGDDPWTTTRLAAVVGEALGGRRGTLPGELAQTFQALRIAVNDEFGALERGLRHAVDLLRPGGRLAVITFHSLEDRIVKRFIATEAAPCICPPEQPVCTCGKVARLTSVGRATKPSPGEIAANPRARSAMLRVAERLPGDIR